MKIKTLAAEATIIRHEERRAPTPKKRNSLHSHRTWAVRPEQRSSLLAYAYIRGRRYRSAEAAAKRLPDMQRTLTIAQSFGSKATTMQDLVAWVSMDAGPCGRDPGVMTQDIAGSTPAASSK